MSLTRDELTEIIYDPALIQRKVLTYTSDFNADEMTISDPTNPFTMLLEATACIASAAIQKNNNALRKTYPSLANVEDDLYHHITDDELTSMFAVPAETKLIFYINIVDMRNNGYRPDDENFVEMTIPKDTVIKILDTDLTLLNDIIVRFYDNNTTYVEQQLNSENDLAYEDVGIISSSITSSSDGAAWITFTTKVKQVTKTTSNKTITPSDSFVQIIPIPGKYCSSLVSYKGTGTNNTYVQLSRAHNDEYIDPQTPTAYISIYDENVQVKIPDTYVIDGGVSGTVKMEIYTTEGEIYLPINKYLPSDFILTLGDTTASKSTAVAKNISTFCHSQDILDGGSNGLSISELRDSIIYNTTGDIDLPITDYQLERSGTLENYTITKSTDVVTQRLYLALRSLPTFDSSLIYAKQEVYFNTCKLTLTDVQNYDNIIINDTNFLIKSNTIFKLNNGQVTICSPEQVQYLENMSNVKLINHLQDTKYFYNPYYYLIELDSTFAESRVYDLDKPEITANRQLERNITINPSANIDKYEVKKVDSGYLINLSLTTNTEFNNLDINSIIVQARIPLYDGTDYVYIDAVYDQEQKIYQIYIDSNTDIDSDNYLDIQNGESDLYTKKMALSNTINIYIITTDPGVIDPAGLLQDEVHYTGAEIPVVIIKESLDITFGTYLEYIYNKLYNVYGARKYQTYEEDVYLTYSKDVYELDPDTGTSFTCVTNSDGTHSLQYTILHNKGDIVYDEDGNPTYKYKKGDSVLDDDGNPIVDEIGGVIRYIDILLLEYEFYVANSVAYESYKENMLTNLKQYIVDDMTSLNSKLLDQTRILYKSFKTSKNVTIVINNTYSSISYLVSPEVTLYLTDTTSITIDEQEQYITYIGEILNNHFENSVIKLEDIKSDIKDTIGATVAGVKISGIDDDDNEVITIKEEHVKLSVGKVLDLNKNSEYIVKYNIKLDIQYI